MDIVYVLESSPSLREAEALTRWLEGMPGVTSALVDATQKSIFVTFESTRITELKISDALKKRGVKIVDQEHLPSVSTDTQGFTMDLERERREVEAETKIQRDADLNIE